MKYYSISGGRFRGAAIIYEDFRPRYVLRGCNILTTKGSIFYANIRIAKLSMGGLPGGGLNTGKTRSGVRREVWEERDSKSGLKKS